MNKNYFLSLLGLLCIFPSLLSMENDPERLIINEAKAGNPEPMIFVIEDALANDKFKKAFKWIARFKIRVRQDATCCNDLSSQSAMDAITIREWTNPKFGEMAQSLKGEERKKIFSKQVDWVENKLKESKLPEPTWIAKYGMNQFIGSSEPLFISPEECKKNRQQILDEYRKQLTEKQ